MSLRSKSPKVILCLLLSLKFATKQYKNIDERDNMHVLHVLLWKRPLVQNSMCIKVGLQLTVEVFQSASQNEALHSSWRCSSHQGTSKMENC